MRVLEPFFAPRPIALLLALALSGLTLAGPTQFGAEAQTRSRRRASPETPAYDQEVLGPGLYAYQTRVRSATCGDDSQTGFVSTFIGAINGIPGSRSMEMKLTNNRYWPEWSITVAPDGVVTGRAQVEGHDREAHFEVRRDDGRFVGTGSRSYTSTVDGQRRRCTVSVDVLLRRFDI